MSQYIKPVPADEAHAAIEKYKRLIDGEDNRGVPRTAFETNQAATDRLIEARKLVLRQPSAQNLTNFRRAVLISEIAKVRSENPFPKSFSVPSKNALARVAADLGTSKSQLTYDSDIVRKTEDLLANLQAKPNDLPYVGNEVGEVFGTLLKQKQRELGLARSGANILARTDVDQLASDTARSLQQADHFISTVGPGRRRNADMSALVKATMAKPFKPSAPSAHRPPTPDSKGSTPNPR